MSVGEALILGPVFVLIIVVCVRGFVRKEMLGFPVTWDRGDYDGTAFDKLDPRAAVVTSALMILIAGIGLAGAIAALVR